MLTRRRLCRKKHMTLTFLLVLVSLSTLQIYVQLSSTRALYLNITSVSFIRHLTETLYTNKTASYWPLRRSSKPGRQAPARVKVIVLSYMRSGSTFCGDLLQAHPDVFYVYEPLFYLWDHQVPKKDKSNGNVRFRTKTYWRQSKKLIPEPLDFIGYLFSCNLSRYNMEFLTNIVNSQDFKAVNGCHTVSRNLSGAVTPTDKCVDQLTRSCRNSSTIVQKVVRLSMAEADRYLEMDPSVRIIHLVRDPRGILLSRMNFNSKLYGEMHKNYTYFCRRMRDDIETSRQIAHKHWGKILTVRYEDLAQAPLQLTELMYSFVGLHMLPSVRNHVQQSTNHDALLSNGKIAAKQTSRKNPFMTASRWRLVLPYPLVKQVEASCREVINAMGYVTFSNEEQLRDLSLPAMTQDYGYGLMTA